MQGVTRSRRVGALALLLAVSLPPACGGEPRPVPAKAAEVIAPAPDPEPVAAALEPAADPALLARASARFTALECNRCHEIESIAAPTPEFDCVGCHRKILAGDFEASPQELAGWQSRIHSLVDVPRLVPGPRFRRAWLQGFLADTHDLRPNLEAGMPRFALAPDDVATLAAWLSPAAETAAPALGDATRGRAVIEAKGCGTCHRMRGVAPLPATTLPIAIAPAALARGQRLAPDLAHARERLRPAALLQWLESPEQLQPGTAMPTIPLDETERRDVAAYLLQAPLEAVAVAAVPERLPLLQREVRYEEVDAKIFHKTCRHCHSDPELVIGDGGPGYSGGFGFPKRGLDLNSYEGILSGSLDEQGQRRSLFSATPQGVPRIVAHLLARHAEQAGRPLPGVRGMPLALPALPLEDIQLLDTWIAQGRKRNAQPGDDAEGAP